MKQNVFIVQKHIYGHKPILRLLRTFQLFPKVFLSPSSLTQDTINHAVAMYIRSVFLRFPWNRITQYILPIQALLPAVGVPRGTVLSLATLEVASVWAALNTHECYVLCGIDKGWFGWLSDEDV